MTYILSTAISISTSYRLLCRSTAAWSLMYMYMLLEQSHIINWLLWYTDTCQCSDFLCSVKFNNEY